MYVGLSVRLGQNETVVVTVDVVLLVVLAVIADVTVAENIVSFLSISNEKKKKKYSNDRFNQTLTDRCGRDSKNASGSNRRGTAGEDDYCRNR